jgi:hypothetical protein
MARFRIVKHKISDAIYLLRFETLYELGSTFLRIQEHYESPRFHGRVFTLEQFMDWYVAKNARKECSFTYFEDWDGFNVPSRAFDPFYDGAFDPLLEKERRLLDEIQNLNLKGRFYIIGVAGKQALKHEIAHALFSVDDGYHDAVCAAMRGFDTSVLRGRILKEGYARHVVDDETQAYIIAPEDNLNGNTRALAPLRRELRALFRKHSAGLKIPKL